MEPIALFLGWVLGSLFALMGGLCFLLYLLFFLPLSISAYRMTKRLPHDPDNMKMFRLVSIGASMRSYARKTCISGAVLAAGAATLHTMYNIKENPMGYTIEMLLVGAVFSGLGARVAATFSDAGTFYALCAMSAVCASAAAYLKFTQ